MAAEIDSDSMAPKWMEASSEVRYWKRSKVRGHNR